MIGTDQLAVGHLSPGQRHEAMDAQPRHGDRLAIFRTEQDDRLAENLATQRRARGKFVAIGGDIPLLARIGARRLEGVHGSAAFPVAGLGAPIVGGLGGVPALTLKPDRSHLTSPYRCRTRAADPRRIVPGAGDTIWEAYSLRNLFDRTFNKEIFIRR